MISKTINSLAFKMITFLVIATIFLGCTAQKDKDSNGITIVSAMNIPNKSKDKASTFILECAKNANPLSDEEGEDLVKQCEETAYNIFGVPRYKICLGRCWSNFIWCDNSVLANEIEACKNAGWIKKEN